MDRNIDLIFLQTSPCVKQGFPNCSKGKRRDGGKEELTTINLILLLTLPACV